MVKSSTIHYAISHLPMIDEKQIHDFWQTTDYDLNKKSSVITAIVQNEDIMITVDTIAKSLMLEGDVGIPVLLSEDDVFAGFKSMSYEGTEFTKSREIKKSYLSKEW